jgi:FAD:protein FMN transferase
MNSKRTFLGATLGVALIGASGGLADPNLQWRDRALHGFGTTLRLRAGHADPSLLDRSLDAAIKTIRHIEAQMSLFDSSSALSRLNVDGYLDKPDPHLVAVLEKAQLVASLSAGTFDVTVQPLWQLWARATKQMRIPTVQELEATRALVGWQSLFVSSAAIRLAKQGMQLTLNGIAQGYAADAAKQVFRDFGIEHALINTGEWSMLGAAEDHKSWRLALADPRVLADQLQKLVTNGDSVATSTDEQNAFGIDRRFHHILDPRSGQSPPDIALVCVVASSCALADALTKVFFMAGFDNTLEVAKQWNVKALVMNKAGSILST